MESQLDQHMRTLKSKLHKIRYEVNLNFEQLIKGDPKIYLPMIHYILIDYSPEMARIIVDNGFDLFAKKDLPFMKSVFSLLLKLFRYKAAISVEQFLTVGFAEHKMILTSTMIDFIRNTVKSSIAKEKKHASISESFSKRSSSLKPRKLDMKQENK